MRIIICSYFTDTSELKSAPLPTFPFGNLHIPKFKLMNPKEDSFPKRNEIIIPISVHTEMDSNENKLNICEQ